MLSPLNTSGRVYWGYSSSFLSYDSLINEDGLIDPGKSLVTESTTSIAGISPPDRIKSPIEVISSTNFSTLASTPS